VCAPDDGWNYQPKHIEQFPDMNKLCRDLVRTKIVIDNKIIEKVNSFNYLGNIISYGKELDIDNKLHNYLKITGILNNAFRSQIS
jgi:hypothetical protein